MHFKEYLVFLLVIAYYSAEAARHDITFLMKQNKLSTKMLQMMFPLNDIVRPSLNMALQNCQHQFKWDRWNCPSSDFLSKRNTKHLDREAAYVRAVTIAAIIYTITKNCTRGEIVGCGCQIHGQSTDVDLGCSDKIDYTELLVKEILEGSGETTLDVQGYAEKHNNRAGRIAVRNALRKHCRCHGISGPCASQTCWMSLNAFPEIASDLRHMYDKAYYLTPENSGVINTKKISEDVLVYVQRSPDYCRENVFPGWGGTRGRRCLKNKSRNMTVSERRSCKHLCRGCGFRIRTREIVKESRCNCKFNWCCEVKCDICIEFEDEYYCN